MGLVPLDSALKTALDRWNKFSKLLVAEQKYAEQKSNLIHLTQFLKPTPPPTTQSPPPSPHQYQQPTPTTQHYTPKHPNIHLI